MDSFINPEEYLDAQRKKMEAKRPERKVPEHPERDVLKFLIDHAPLDRWERDVLEVIRDESYYFVPQRQTKIMNEGWASYWHSKMMTEKVLNASEIIDYADNNAGVMATSPGRLNPYKLGVELYRYVEDRWNKGRFGREWEECSDLDAKRNWDMRLGLGQKKIFQVRALYNDVTFIDEFLTPEFMMDQKMYTFGFSGRNERFEIESREFKEVKEKLLFQLTNFGDPLIRVVDANYSNRGELLLEHQHGGLGFPRRLREGDALGDRPGLEAAGGGRDQGRQQGRAAPLRRQRAHDDAVQAVSRRGWLGAGHRARGLRPRGGRGREVAVPQNEPMPIAAPAPPPPLPAPAATAAPSASAVAGSGVPLDAPGRAAAAAEPAAVGRARRRHAARRRAPGGRPALRQSGLCRRGESLSKRRANRKKDPAAIVGLVRARLAKADVPSEYAAAPKSPVVAAAIRDLKNAIKLDDGYEPAHLDLGKALLVQGKADDADKELMRAVELAPADAEAHSARGVAELARGHMPDALRELGRAAELAPGDAERQTNLGTALLASGKAGEALRAYERAARMAPNDARVLNDLGTAYLAANDPTRAVKYLESAVAKDPRRATYRSNLGYAYHLSGDLPRAMATYKEALKLDDKLASAWINLGNLYAQQGNYADARDAYAHAKRIDPTDPRVKAVSAELDALEKSGPPKH